MHFLRGLENTWTDIYDAPDQLAGLIDVLADMSIAAVERFAGFGADGYIFCDDWGPQHGLMVAPDSWRALWKPRYERVFRAVHEHGMVTFMHSCGDITSILDDLIEIGLDVVHMDQQENMGLDLLHERFSGRITFFSPVDIQNTMVNGSEDDIRTYCRRMVELLGTDRGGFIPRWYQDPEGAGHTRERVELMCRTFLQLSREHYGA